jgi:hypothetical protein
LSTLFLKYQLIQKYKQTELALSRGEHLEKMRTKTENLEEKAVFFRKKAKAVYCTMLQENMQTTVILVGIILVSNLS